MKPADSGAEQVFHGACPHDCPDACAMLITVEMAWRRGFGAIRPIRRRRRALHQGLALSGAHLQPRPGPLSAAPRRRQGQGGRALRAHRLGRGPRHDRRAAQSHRRRRSAGHPAVCILGTLGLVHNFGMPRRFFHWLGASLPERVALRDGRPAGYTLVIGAQIGTDITHFADAADRSVGHQSGHVEPAPLDAHRRASGMAHASSPSTRTARCPPRRPTGTSRRCPAPTRRWLSA